MLLNLLCGVAFAGGKAEKVARLQADGKCAEAVELADRWAEKAALGDEEKSVLAVRDRCALDAARAANTTAALAAYRSRYPKSSLFAEAQAEEWDLAFSLAQDEGTSAAMAAYVLAYPDSTRRPQAAALEAGLAYQEAIAVGTPEAIEAFVRTHPDSPYAANAWEGAAARTEGIYLLLADGRPQRLDMVLVDGEHVALPDGLPVGQPVPRVAVNIPGAGRGATSAWWGLHALVADGDRWRLSPSSPLGRRLEQVFGTAPPGLLDLAEVPGTHSARVAATLEPVVDSGACEGFARFALVLANPEGGRAAWPFLVDCEATSTERTAAVTVLQAAEAAEKGDARTAGILFDQVRGQPGSDRVLAWLRAGGREPKDVVTRRPAIGDVLVWDGASTVWWHQGADGPVELSRADGMWIAQGEWLWAWRKVEEPVEARAAGGCRAAKGVKISGALTDVRGASRISVPLEGSPRGGSLAPTAYEAGVVSLIEAPDAGGCRAAPPPLPRTVRLPDAMVMTPLPAWAAPLVEGKAGWSVVAAAPAEMGQAFGK
jgi:hypothetical protein